MTKAITYSDDDQYIEGKTPREIFEAGGFNVAVLGMKRVEQSAKGTPGLVLLTNITYLPYGRSEMAYLSTILDASTGELLSYNLSSRLNMSLATDINKNLMKQRRLKFHKDAFIHSDQGFYYTNPKYQKLLKKKRLSQSMSRRGNCWDKAPQESFYGHMKDHVISRNCSTLEELKFEIDRYIHYYNHHKYQWGLKRMTPVQYRNHLLSVA